jgi:hypothetical protein
VTAPLLAIIVVLLVAPYALFRTYLDPYALGVLAGVPSGLIISLGLYFATGPSLELRIVRSKFDGKSAGFWVHLDASNNSWNVLGSGTGYACLGKVKFDELPEWATSWKGRPDPQRDVPFSFPNGQTVVMGFAEPLMFEQKRTETIRPGETRTLDIVWRPKGKEECYLSIPELFRGPAIVQYEELELGVGEHPFSVRVDYQKGSSRPQRFVLVVKAGLDLNWDSVSVRPAG